MLLLAVAVDMLSWPSSGVACANTLLSPPLLILEIIGTAVGMKLWLGCCADNNDSDNGGSNSARVSSWCSTLDVNGDGDGRVVPAESFFVVVSIMCRGVLKILRDTPLSRKIQFPKRYPAIIGMGANIEFLTRSNFESVQRDIAFIAAISIQRSVHGEYDIQTI